MSRFSRFDKRLTKVCQRWQMLTNIEKLGRKYFLRYFCFGAVENCANIVDHKKCCNKQQQQQQQQQHKPYSLGCVKIAISEKTRENEVQIPVREN